MTEQAQELGGRHVVLGVTGGIAVYKSVALASLLTQAGAVVDVIMTEAAQKFVLPLSFAAITRREVFCDMFAPYLSKPGHIALSERGEVFVVAPATGNTLAKVAHGIADNLLTSTILATRAPLLVAPAMNEKMWRNPATQENMLTLIKRGVHTVGPEEGYLACGVTGEGRMSEPEQIFAAIRALLER